ncbi:hypothetical protein CGZ93_09440 [Enemella dayhoffiae]|uniref:Tetratricopeptide repeat protein n=1 Tax=Enemella dayhoffiae TaxID=2016507 RepID=A0A255H4J1_9ACTN|nr:tetratricopeptide repeat protein [Enemella dayhoffiae]OYO22113.1 hypothetical protein CGZ93_09440 [Enemella dayhoffiae]
MAEDEGRRTGDNRGRGSGSGRGGSGRRDSGAGRPGRDARGSGRGDGGASRGGGERRRRDDAGPQDREDRRRPSTGRSGPSRGRDSADGDRRDSRGTGGSRPRRDGDSRSRRQGEDTRGRTERPQFRRDDRTDEPRRRPTRSGQGGPDPQLPEDLDLRQLPRGVKAELKGLPLDLADKVGPRLLAAGLLVDLEPELAYAHAKVARRLASRLPVVRAAVAETAYAAADFAAALSEYRALRRMSGGDEYLPVMADCERALGRPDEALKLARQAERLDLDPATRIEMRIVEAGARADQGQHAEARRLLESEIQGSRGRRVPATSAARLRYAYAEQLLEAGDRDGAHTWFGAAAKLDSAGETDADERVAQLEGLVIDFDETEDDDAQPETDDEQPAATRDYPAETGLEQR